ncbi:hypothetical protein BH10PSE1_BH10PSE1_10920 [soil metagenome]
MQAPQVPMSSSPTLAVDDMVGFWRIRPQSGAAFCLIALNRDEKAGGYGVHIETCAVPVLSSAVDWRPVSGGFELRGKSGVLVARFQMIDVDHFASAEAGYRMERAPVS